MKATEIAKWFLLRDRLKAVNGQGIELSNLKLQKLLYYAQGVYLAVYKKELFEDNIVAWQHGPVIEEVYREYKCNKGKIIRYTSQDQDLNIMKNIESKQGVRDVLEFVFNEFGQYSAWKLRDMTHEEKPWKQTDLNAVIDNDLIKNYFLDEVIEV